MADDNFLNEFLDDNSNAVWGSTSSSVRQFVDDYRAGRYDFNLPFQRKPQWRDLEKSEWVSALLRGKRLDPLSISIRMGVKRGINGGNRGRATRDYVLNRFPMEVNVNRAKHYYWFSEIPPEHSVGRYARFHHVLPITTREEKFLDREIHFNVGRNLTDQEEVEWYNNMNKNQKAHTKGQLLVSNLCREIDNPFVVATLELFPVLKTRIQIPLTEADSNTLGSQLADMFNNEPNPMDERDTREDYALVFATYTNLLGNGKPYNDGFVGECDRLVVQQNANTLLQIFDDLRISEGMTGEFYTPSNVKKQFIPNIWAPAYLLGPICWSIGNQKENVVHVWRSFLERCLPNTIMETYLRETNERHLDDTSVTKYKTAWENVLASTRIN